MILCVVSFLVATVTLKNGIAPFSIAILVAVCSSSIPAGAIFVTTGLGVLAGSFLISIVLFRPIIQPDKNEISKLGKNLVISMAVTYFLPLWFRKAGYEDYLMVLVNILLSYSFYKVFVNSFNIIDKITFVESDFASTLEELIAIAILLVVACSAFAKLRIYWSHCN